LERRPELHHYAREIYSRAERLYAREQVEVALDRMAAELTERLETSEPVMLCMMLGGMIPATKLLDRLGFMIELDYVHATRYGDRTRGGGLKWIRPPPANLRDRVVVVVDDILDEGVTLAAVVQACVNAGVRSVHTAVLVDKQRPRVTDVRVDVVGLTVPNRYVFGYGMDYRGYLRNADGIYALEDHA
jgi:hypoxanthine phosphoribosyltransferase